MLQKMRESLRGGRGVKSRTMGLAVDKIIGGAPGTHKFGNGRWFQEFQFYWTTRRHTEKHEGGHTRHGVEEEGLYLPG